MGGAPAGTASTSKGLRTACIALFWSTAAMTVFVVVALVNRRSVWVDLVEGRLGIGDLGRASEADDLVSAAFGLTFLVSLAALIVLSIWSLRVGRRARETGAGDVSPGLLCGSWYIPYAAAIVPFIQLRRVARHHRRSTASLNVWQGFFVAAWVTATAVAGLDPDENDVFDDLDDITDMLTGQLVAAVLTMIVTFVMAFVATQALRTIDG